MSRNDIESELALVLGKDEQLQQLVTSLIDIGHNALRTANSLGLRFDGTNDPDRRAAVPTISLLSNRSKSLILRMGDLVLKAHAPGTDPHELAQRLELLRHTGLNLVFLQPIEAEPQILNGQRLVTLWPAVHPLGEDQLAQAPWEEAAKLLAKLHAVPLPPASDSKPLPRCRAVQRVQESLARLCVFSRTKNSMQPEVEAVRAAAATLPILKQSEPLEKNSTNMSFVHGDWHFGQLVSLPGSAALDWRLIDIDDLGIGDPAWDLARPAAFFAAGLIPGDVWETFLRAYLLAGGTAVSAAASPWQTLELPARALVVQCAASAVVKAMEELRTLQEAELALIDACRRIARTSPRA